MNPGSLQIAIAGGGTCGLVVLLSLLEEARKGKRIIRSIYIFEKHSQVGPGLAYSNSSGNAIINMRADTMGLHASDPLDFSRWMKSHHPETASSQYPPRQIYGEYLSSAFESAVRESASSGIELEIIHEELLEVHPIGDHVFQLLGDHGRRVTVNKVVLALGNFAACSQQHLTHKPGYISNPWNFKAMDDIPTQATVGIVGSRLSGIDAALHLVENGHEGPIYLVSRGGRLPKVQGRESARPYRNQYDLHVLARDLEESSSLPNHLHVLLERFKLFAEQLGVKDWADFFRRKDPLHQLSLDIEESEKGLVHWRSLADSASPILERFWNTLLPDDQALFMNTWGSLWYAYVHAMPLENAHRLLRLLVEDRLRVSKFNEILGDEHGFTITLPGQQARAEYIVEASGLEVRASNIQSPLIQSLLSSRVLEEHHVGGLSVDQYTMESTSTRGLYVIGSLTTGVHFYTNGIDSNAKHASRIAKHLVGESVYPPAHVALILPGDSEFWGGFIQNAVAAMLKHDLVPFIYLTQSNNLDELNSNAVSDSTVDALRKQFGIAVQSCHASDPSFLIMLQDHHIDICLLPSKGDGGHSILTPAFGFQQPVSGSPFDLLMRSRDYQNVQSVEPDRYQRHGEKEQLEHHGKVVLNIVLSLFDRVN